MKKTWTLIILFFAFHLFVNGQCINTPEFPFTTFEEEYSWSGNIYPQSEVGGAVAIQSISFYLDNPVSFNQTYSDFEIYIRHTSDTQYPSFGKSWSSMSLGAGDLYYDGPLALTNGQGLYTLTLSSSFAYNGTDNLEVVFACVGGDANTYQIPQEPWFRRTVVYADYPGNVAFDNALPFSFEVKARRQFKLLLVVNGNQEIGIAQDPNDCDAILPIELVNFDAKYNERNGSTELSWTTITEFNNDYFEIQRSDDGREFEAIGKIFGHGNSIVENHYSFEDNTINCTEEKPIYYRLKQVDMDGMITFSEVKVISCKKRAQEITSYLEGHIIHLLFETNTFGQIVLLNTIGQTLQAETIHDRNNFQIDVTNLPKGIYFVTMKYNNGNQTTIKVYV